MIFVTWTTAYEDFEQRVKGKSTQLLLKNLIEIRWVLLILGYSTSHPLCALELCPPIRLVFKN